MINSSDGLSGLRLLVLVAKRTINHPNSAHVHNSLNVHNKFRTDSTIDVILPYRFLERFDVGDRSDRDNPLRVHLHDVSATALGCIHKKSSVRRGATRSSES